MTRIKICGITCVEDALWAAQLAVDFAGFVFYPPSPRHVKPEKALECIQAMREGFAGRAPKAIGVFVDTPPDLINQISRQAALDGAQFAGDETPEMVRQVGGIRFKGISLKTLNRLGRYEVDAYLCDTHAPREKGGTGRPYLYALLRPHMVHHTIIVAGGLTPETVGDVVRNLQPWGVDVSSALEAVPGKKDWSKMQAFVAAVRQASGD